MATESYKETMLVLMDDYIEYAKELNEAVKELSKPESLKLSFLDYSQLYMDYLSISNQEPLEEDFDDDDDLKEEALRQMDVLEEETHTEDTY